MGVSWVMTGFPPVIIYFSGIFPYKPSSDKGVPPWLWKPPNMWDQSIAPRIGSNDLMTVGCLATTHPRLLQSSATVTKGVALQTVANNSPSGKTSWRLWRLICNFCAIRCLMSNAKSDPRAFKRNTSCPAKSKHVRIMSFSSETRSSCKTRSLQWNVRSST